jgi:hypothetical protein
LRGKVQGSARASVGGRGFIEACKRFGRTAGACGHPLPVWLRRMLRSVRCRTSYLNRRFKRRGMAQIRARTTIFLNHNLSMTKIVDCVNVLNVAILKRMGPEVFTGFGACH